MASHGCPTDIGVVLHPEQGYNRFSKDFHNFLPHQGSKQDRFNSHSLNLSLQQKENWKFSSGLLDRDNLITLDSTFKRPTSIQGARPDSELSSFGIADKCTSQDKILQLLASGSKGVENGLFDLFMLHNLMGHPDFAPFTQQSLIYPTSEFYFKEPFVEYMCNSDGQLWYNFSGTESNDVFAEISDLYSSKNTSKSSKQTMLVPFFERRKRAQASNKASNLVTEKAGPLKSHDKVKGKTSPKKKSPTRTIKEREKSYSHTCEILLSVLANKKHQQTKNVIHSLKKSVPQLPELLTQCSATIAGAGIAVVYQYSVV